MSRKFGGRIIMYALFLILNQIDKLDEIRDILYELGLGSTTIDSIGMGKVLLKHDIDSTILTSLRNILNEDKPYNKTLISVINDKEVLDKAVEKISIILDIDNKKAAGFLFVLPVLYSVGGYSDKD
jgi:nitrogen regulatory protein PII